MATKKPQADTLFDLSTFKDQLLSEYGGYEPAYKQKEKMTPDYLKTMVWAQVMCTIVGKLFDADNVFSWKTGLLIGVLMCFDELKPVFSDMGKEAMINFRSALSLFKNSSIGAISTVCSKVYMKGLSFYYNLLYIFGRQLPPSPYKSPYKSWPIKYGDKFVEAFVRWLEENKDNCRYETVSHSHYLDTKDTNISFVNYIITQICILNEWVKCDLQFTVSKALGSTAKFVAEKTVDPKTIQNITEVWDQRINNAVQIFKESVCKHYNLSQDTLISLLGNQVTDTNILFHNNILKKKYPSIDIMSSVVDVFMFAGMVNALNLPLNIVTKDGEKYRYILDPSNVYKVDDIGQYRDYTLIVPSPFDNAVFAAADVMSAVPNIISLLDQRGEDPNVFSFYYEASENFNDDKMRMFVDSVYNYECKTSRPVNVYTLELATRVAKVEESDNPNYVQWCELKKVAEKSDETMVAFIKSYPKPPEKLRKEIIETYVEKKLINDAIKLLDSLYLQDDDYRRLIQTLDQYRNNKQVFEDLSLQYKLNMLLYGKPGCGKSTCITAIATYLGKDIYYVKLNNVKTNEDMQKICEYAFKGSARSGVIVMEDIDAMTNAVHKRTPHTKVNHNGLTLDYLLNLLQGTLTMKDSIFIVTTNHIEKLDPAFYRVGRFDQKIRFKLADHSQIRRIHKRMLNHEIPEEILMKINEYQFPPAEFIFLLKEYLYSPDTDPETIYDGILKRSLKLRIKHKKMLPGDDQLLLKYTKPKQVTEDIDCTVAYDDIGEIDEEYVEIGDDDDNIELNESPESSVMSPVDLEKELEMDVKNVLQKKSTQRELDSNSDKKMDDSEIEEEVNIANIIKNFSKELTNQNPKLSDNFVELVKKQAQTKQEKKTNSVVEALENKMEVTEKNIDDTAQPEVLEVNANVEEDNVPQLSEEELLRIIAEDDIRNSTRIIDVNPVKPKTVPYRPTTYNQYTVAPQFTMLPQIKQFGQQQNLQLNNFFVPQATPKVSKKRTSVSRVV